MYSRSGMNVSDVPEELPGKDHHYDEDRPFPIGNVQPRGKAEERTAPRRGLSAVSGRPKNSLAYL
jgi:hypothetical protein